MINNFMINLEYFAIMDLICPIKPNKGLLCVDQPIEENNEFVINISELEQQLLKIPLEPPRVSVIVEEIDEVVIPADKKKMKKKKNKPEESSCIGKIVKLVIATGVTGGNLAFLLFWGFTPITAEVNKLSNKSWTTLGRLDELDMSRSTVWELVKKYGLYTVSGVGAFFIDTKLLHVQPVVQIGTSMIVTSSLISSFMKDYKLLMKRKGKED